MLPQHRAHLADRVHEAVAEPLPAEVREDRLDQPVPVGLAHPLVDAAVAQDRELAVLDAHVDEHAVPRGGPVHAEPLEDQRLPRTARVEMHPDLGGGRGLRGRDGRGHRGQIGLVEEPPHPAWMTRHHQLPLEPPPPKPPPPPLNPPPPLLPPPLPPPKPPPPMKGPPQPDEPPVHPRRRTPALCMRFCTRMEISTNTTNSAASSRKPRSIPRRSWLAEGGST